MPALFSWVHTGAVCHDGSDDEEEAYNLRLKEKYQDQGSIGKRIWLASFDIEKI